jgi:hypothetical protein
MFCPQRIAASTFSSGGHAEAFHRLLWNNMMAGKTQIDGQVGTGQLLTIDRKCRRNDVRLSLLRSSANSSE